MRQGREAWNEYISIVQRFPKLPYGVLTNEIGCS